MPCQTITVEKKGQANLQVTSINLSKSTANPGETFTITAKVKNQGILSGLGTVEFTVDGSTIATPQVGPILPDSTVSVELDTSIDSTGDHNVCATMRLIF